MHHFIPSQDPAEGLGVLMLFRLIEEAIPSFFRADRMILVTRAPGRLDVMGGLGAHQGGTALQLPTAEAACAAIQARDDDLVRLWSPCRDGSRTQLLSVRLQELGLPQQPFTYADARALVADPRDRWAGYLLGGLLALARERGLVVPHGAELLLHSDVPEGRGVGASAAITIAALRAFALLHRLELTAADLAELSDTVAREVLGAPPRTGDAVASVVGLSGELCVVGAEPPGDDRLPVPSDLEFIGLDTGVRGEGSDEDVQLPADELARSERFRRLLAAEPTAAHRRELGELMFASHRAWAAAGLGHDAAEVAVDAVRARRDAGGQVLGARLGGRGSGGTVVMLGERGKVWYEALRVKKALLTATGHSAHVFRWSSPGAMAFGAIHLVPKTAG